MILWNDAETFSEADLKVVGTYRYAEHPSTEVLLMTYAVDGGAVRTWSPAEGEPIPADLLAALKDPAVVKIAHNAAFDRNVVPRSLHRMGWISAAECEAMVSATGWLCTMAQALAHALPADLDTLGRVLGLPQNQAKLATGKKLIQRFCKPAPKNHKARRYDHTNDPPPPPPPDRLGSLPPVRSSGRARHARVPPADARLELPRQRSRAVAPRPADQRPRFLCRSGAGRSLGARHRDREG